MNNLDETLEDRTPSILNNHDTTWDVKGWLLE